MLFARRFGKKHSYSRSGYALVALGCVLTALALCLSACGLSSTGVAGSGDQSAATATVSNIGGGTSVKPCPIVGTNVNLSAPALVLTPASAKQEATAHVGDLIVVELPTTMRWQLTQAASAQLQPNDPQGALDDSLNACVWSFHAQSAGAATLDFTGSAICEGGKPCSQLAVDLNFKVNVD